MANWKNLKPFILQWEGGFVNDSSDLGGATNRGITLGAFRTVYGGDKTVADLKALTDQQWDNIFRQQYWDKWQGSLLKSQSVANILVDWLWCSGSYGIRIPQRVLGVTSDGIVGRATLNAANRQASRALFDRLRQERIDFIDRICKTRPENKKFRQGWLNRIAALKYTDK